MGHVEIGVGHAGVGGSFRGGVDYAGMGGLCRGGICHTGVEWSHI